MAFFEGSNEAFDPQTLGPHRRVRFPLGEHGGAGPGLYPQGHSHRAQRLSRDHPHGGHRARDPGPATLDHHRCRCVVSVDAVTGGDPDRLLRCGRLHLLPRRSAQQDMTDIAGKAREDRLERHLGGGKLPEELRGSLEPEIAGAFTLLTGAREVGVHHVSRRFLGDVEAGKSVVVRLEDGGAASPVDDAEVGEAAQMVALVGLEICRELLDRAAGPQRVSHDRPLEVLGFTGDVGKVVGDRVHDREALGVQTREGTAARGVVAVDQGQIGEGLIGHEHDAVRQGVGVAVLPQHGRARLGGRRREDRRGALLPLGNGRPRKKRHRANDDREQLRNEIPRAHRPPHTQLHDHCNCARRAIIPNTHR